MYKEIYYRELANVIIEAEKSQYLSRTGSTFPASFYDLVGLASEKVI